MITNWNIFTNAELLEAPKAAQIGANRATNIKLHMDVSATEEATKHFTLISPSKMDRS